jgi:hypothetical protein
MSVQRYSTGIPKDLLANTLFRLIRVDNGRALTTTSTVAVGGRLEEYLQVSGGRPCLKKRELDGPNALG